MIRSDVRRTTSPLWVGIVAMLVMAMMLLWLPGVRAQGLVEYALILPILLTTSDERCSVGGYQVETRGLTLADAVMVEAAPDPRGQGCLVRVKAGVALPAQSAAIETLVDGGVLTLSSTAILTEPFPFTLPGSPGGSVVFEVVAEAKTSPPHEEIGFTFRPIGW